MRTVAGPFVEGHISTIGAQSTFGLVWALVYTVFLCTAISWANRRAFGVGGRWQRGNLAPVWAALFDLLENASTSLVMIRHPRETAVVDNLGVFTMVQWLLVSGSFVLLLGLGIGVWRWAGARSQEPGVSCWCGPKRPPHPIRTSLMAEQTFLNRRPIHRARVSMALAPTSGNTYNAPGRSIDQDRFTGEIREKGVLL